MPWPEATELEQAIIKTFLLGCCLGEDAEIETIFCANVQISFVWEEHVGLKTLLHFLFAVEGS